MSKEEQENLEEPHGDGSGASTGRHAAHTGAHHAHEEHIELNQEQVQEIDSEFDRMMASQKISFEDVKKHLVGPLISFAVHAVLIVLLATMVTTKITKEAKDVEMTAQDMEIKDFEPPPEPPPVEEQLEVDVEVEIERPTTTTSAQPTERVSVEVADVGSDTPDVVVDLPEISAIKPTKSMLKMPKLFSARAGGKARASAIKKYGGSRETEASVVKALEWLAKNQNEDGTWGVFKGNQTQYTALALLAFLGHGETPLSEKYGPTIIKAIGVLMKVVAQYKNHAIPDAGYTYTHPVVVYALAEAYGLTKMPKIKEALNLTLEPVIKGHNKHGAYWPGYTNWVIWPKRDEFTGAFPPMGSNPDKYTYHCDTAYTAWNAQAMKAAYAAGCDAENLEKCMIETIRGLKYIGQRPDAFGKNADFGTICMLDLSLGFMGEGGGKESKEGEKFLTGKENKFMFETCSWRQNPEVMKRYPKAFTNAVFVWYYQTQVAFQLTKGKGYLWKKWVKEFSRAMVKEQEDDGHWSTPAQKYGQALPANTAAEWTKITDYKDEKDLNIFSTVYCCLTLEVFYRYLPTYKMSLSGKDKVKEKAKDEDLGLSIM